MIAGIEEEATGRSGHESPGQGMEFADNELEEELRIEVTEVGRSRLRAVANQARKERSSGWTEHGVCIVT